MHPCTIYATYLARLSSLHPWLRNNALDDIVIIHVQHAIICLTEHDRSEILSYVLRWLGGVNPDLRIVVFRSNSTSAFFILIWVLLLGGNVPNCLRES